jgi:membrane-bound inhibitor of C-type lysozyme
MSALRAGFLLAFVMLPAAYASNTAPTRSFTTDWVCANGRILRMNSHPRRPPQEAQLTYGGSRVEVQTVATSSGVRYASKDGKVIWHINGREGQLTFEPLLSAPITCTMKSDAQDAKSQKKN